MSIQLQEIKNMYVPKIQQIEYLESTGTQYIDTEFKHNNNTRFVTLLSFQSVSAWNYPFGAFGDSNKRSIFALEINYEERLYSYYGYINAKKSFNQKVKLNYLYNIDFNKNTHTINDMSVVHDTSNFSSIYNTFIFASSNYDGTPTLTNKVRCYYFQIYDNGTLVRDFIPVRIGTKGYMLDKVSGELYGNSGTGDFILGQDVGSINYSKNLQQIYQNYQNKLIEGVDYQVYDWLKGDGIINYDKPIDYLSDNLRIKIRNLDSNSGYNTIWVGGDTNPGKNDWSRCIIDFEVVNGVAIKQVQWCEYVYGGSYQHFPTSSDNIYTFDININRAIINGVTYSMTSSRCNVTTPFVITLRKADSIAYCKLNNVDMYPCKLLKPIPRNLDANNIARSAGDCGMIDLISGKFYGNVASSGTFTVENDNNE